ncbi:MAG: hypothetical protein ED557_10640 [Balneola sp.]|nr:MAG: hypothetical protein ED557_10640 [Balneola sp.]
MSTREPVRKGASKEEFFEEQAQEFSEAPEQTTESVIEEEPLPYGIPGIYRKGGLTLTFYPELLPTNETLIVILRSNKGPTLYMPYYQRLISSLGLEPDYFDRAKVDYSFSGYKFYRLPKSQVVAIRNIHPVEESYNTSARFITELVSIFRKNFNIGLDSIFDTSLYYWLSETSEQVKIPPLLFLGDIGFFESNPIAVSMSYPESATQRLVKDLSGGWEELGATADPEPTPNPPARDTSQHDKIDFHLDNPALDDKLSRRPIAEDLARIINNDIFGNEKCYSFMAHLQGRWGEGKSSFMSFLEDGLQLHGDDKWIVIHYNAWENQHVDPPWWTFLDALYAQSKKQIGEKRSLFSRWTFQLSEFINRFNKASLRLIIFVLVLIIFLMVLVPFEERIANTFAFLAPLLGETKITILALLGGGTLVTVIQSWSKFLFMHNAENARLFVAKTENPAEAVRSHFDNLVNSIQKRSGSKEQPFRIAFFIDDLDRCDSGYIVKLLEGIQTMFNKQKVFYLVAADKHWIAKSFEHEYAKYSDTVKKGTKLGYSFIEKNFQLSVRLPNPSPDQISDYWDYILGPNDPGDKKDSKENIEAFKSEFSQTTQEEILSGNADISGMLEKYQISLEAAQSIVLEKVNETTKDIEHLLKEYHKLIGSNPRAVKRLANQYTIYRNIVLLEQGHVEPKKLFRWIVLQNRWPILVDQIELKPDDIGKVTKAYLQNINLDNHLEAIKFVIGTGKERLTKDDVNTYSGISNLALDPISND